MPSPSLAAVDHRAWPPPAGRWVMAQSWSDLLFAHAPVEPDALRAALDLPAGLELDLHDGRAWVGVVPFRMSGVRLRSTPALPWLSAFPELNVRTYVVHGDRPGVWFTSLDAANPVAVRIARGWFRLPYFDARMECSAEGEVVRYASVRTHRGAPPAVFHGRYRPVGPVFRARPGTLEHFLAERYCLYARGRRGELLRGEIHHGPWPLQSAELELDESTMAAASGISLGPFEHLLFARRIDVRCWSPSEVS